MRDHGPVRQLGGSMTPRVSRRGFLAAAFGTGAALAVPWPLQRHLLHLVEGTADASANPELFFLTAAQYRTCVALCSRIVPTGAAPTTDPGATEMHAALFIDRFLSAFELPAAVAENPALYLHGRFTGRNALPDPTTGRPSATHPADDTRDDPTGPSRFLALTRFQTLVWRAQLYGAHELDQPWVSPAWRKQVGTLLARPDGLRDVYAAGLEGFDSYSRTLFGRPFAQASPFQQDVMIEAAGNVILSQVPAPGIGAPDAAKAVFGALVTHTFQATYGLPQYRGESAAMAEAIWRHIGWDGDTMPLGNSIYWDAAFGPGQGPNAGFGDPAGYQPRGTYREYRPVSTLDEGDGRSLTAADIAPLLAAWRAAGIVKDGPGQ
jgi:gluconate 2-dehydrogenase subunit 3-like protein